MDPPPVDPPGLAFRYDVIPWLDEDEEEDGEDVIDLSRLSDDSGLIDTGVTSGSDPSAWDPILIDPESALRDD